MRRLLILSAGFGEGHNAAARGLAAAAASALGPDGCAVADCLMEARPRTDAFLRRRYLGLINGMPGLWRLLYRATDSGTLYGPRIPLLGTARKALERRVADFQPDAICCTYPIYGYICDALRSRGMALPPVYMVVTDSITVHASWTQMRCEGWFVPNRETGDEIVRQGAPASRVHDRGFPVSPAFETLAARCAPPDLASGSVPRVLQMLNSGTRDGEAIALRLLRETEWHLTLAVGRDEGLRQRLQRMAEGRLAPTTVLGWTDRMPELLMTHHAVIGKAGGATTQEALAARCPMVVHQIVPGQEEGNYRLIEKRGCGAYAEGDLAMLAVLRSAFASGGAGWRRWREAAASLSRPRAASDIVDHLLKCGNSKGTKP